MIDQIATAAKTISARLHSRGIERTQGQVIRYVVDMLERNRVDVSEGTVCNVLTKVVSDVAAFRLLVGAMTEP